jgi:outer membrane receptor protein involved in Fe transport
VYTPVYRAANYADYQDGAGYVYEYFGANYALCFTGRQAAHVFGARSDWQIPVVFAPDYKAKVKTGIYANFRIRDFRSRLAGHYVSFDENGQPISELSYEQVHVSNIRNIHSDPYIGPGMFTASDSTGNYHNYFARGDNYAGYASFEMRFPYRFRLNFGLRFEHFRQYIGLRTIDDETHPVLVASVKNDVLPSATLIWSPNEKSNVRMAYSHTVVRPGDRDLTPLPFLNLPFGVYTRGNPLLQRTLAQNFDLRYEFFPSGTELLSVSAFRKRLNNPIEQRITQGIIGENLNTYEFVNARNADIAGIELEIRVNLGRTFNSSFLQNFVFYGNATFSQSRVDNERFFDFFQSGRSLQGQSGTIFNTGILFLEPKTKIKLGVFFNRAGRRIALVGVGDDIFPGVYELPRNIIDLQISRMFFNKLEIRFDAQDVLNNPIRWVHIYSSRPMFDAFVPGRDRYIRNIKGQVNLSLTVSYSF